MATLFRNYDAWRLSTPDDYRADTVGVEDGEPCNRYPEPDEDAPRGWRPRPCGGLMAEVPDGEDTIVVCESCGAIA